MKDYYLSGNWKFFWKKKENNCVICVGMFLYNLSFGGKLKCVVLVVIYIKDSLLFVILCNWSLMFVLLDVSNVKYFYFFFKNIKLWVFCKYLMLILSCFMLFVICCWNKYI